MSENPYRAGDFVWSAFPARENPAHPGPRHVGYVALSINAGPRGSVFLAYTTSQPWSGRRPFGVYAFEREAAASMGQSRAFTLDLRRLAAIPVSTAWFPDLTERNHGIVGRAPESLRLTLEADAKQLFGRRPETIERLGPLWPR